MTKLINLTPHTINIQVSGSEPVTIEPSGTVARVAVKSVADGEIAVSHIKEVFSFEQETEVELLANIPIFKSLYGEVEGIPAPTEGVGYIVSALVGGRVSGRTDVFGPDSDPSAIRNDKGQIVAVRQLVRF